MALDLGRRGLFINYRRADTGWAANLVANALRTRLGPSVEVFLDNRSIALGEAFDRSLEDGVRRSAVLIALIGPRWDTPPLADRLSDPQDWMRKEILLARKVGSLIIPVLVDRDAVPVAPPLPVELGFLRTLQAAWIRQQENHDLDVLAERVAQRLAGPLDQRSTSQTAGVERTPPALDAFLRRILPPAQQRSGNRDRLVDLVLAVLGRDDQLVYLAPCRINNGPKGSAAVMITGSDIVVVEVGEDFLLTGEIRFPLSLVRRVEVVPTLFLFADTVVHTTAGDAVRLEGMFRGQARDLADHLRP